MCEAVGELVKDLDPRRAGTRSEVGAHLFQRSLNLLPVNRTRLRAGRAQFADVGLRPAFLASAHVFGSAKLRDTIRSLLAKKRFDSLGRAPRSSSPEGN